MDQTHTAPRQEWKHPSGPLGLPASRASVNSVDAMMGRGQAGHRKGGLNTHSWKRVHIAQIQCRYLMRLLKNKSNQTSKLPMPPRSCRIRSTPLACTRGLCDLVPILHLQPHLPWGHHTLLQLDSSTHSFPRQPGVFQPPSLCSYHPNLLEFLLFSTSPFRTSRSQFAHQTRISSLLPLFEPQGQHSIICLRSGS